MTKALPSHKTLEIPSVQDVTRHNHWPSLKNDVSPTVLLGQLPGATTHTAGEHKLSARLTTASRALST